MNDIPDIPDPQKAPADQPTPEPTSAGPESNGAEPNNKMPPGQDKFIQWVEATDKELKMIKLTQLVLCGAVLMLIVISAKPKSISIPSSL